MEDNSESMSYPPDENKKGIKYFNDEEKSQVKILRKKIFLNLHL